MPLISIIIPTYNSGQTLAVCLKSIAVQSFKDFEVLIIDGVSKDATVSIATGFVDLIPGLRVFSEPDKGIYDAMNKGVSKAKGEWLYFLGSDDFLYDEQSLTNISNGFADAVDVVYGNIYRREMAQPIYGGEFDLYRITHKNMGHQSMFYRRNIFEKTGLYDLSYKVMADHLLNTKLFLTNGIRTKYVDCVVAEYSEGGTSTIYSHDDEQIRIKQFILAGNFQVPIGLRIELCFQILNFNRKINYLSLLERFYIRCLIYFYVIVGKFQK